MKFTLPVTAALLLAPTLHALAGAPPAYRVTEIHPPASLTSGCQPGYGITRSITAINDLGVVNATVTCYTNVVAEPLSYQFLSGTMVGAPWLGSFALPTSGPGQSYSYTINNRGELFGYEVPDAGGFFGARWSLAGGYERIFDDPDCGTIRFSAATGGNGRYTVGWALRGDPRLPPPVDELCIATRWVILDAAGTETSGPLYGTPYSINASSFAVGTSSNSAIRYNVATGEILVLHAATDTSSAEATHINDLGEITGRITQTGPATSGQCAPGVAVRWDRKGREYVLPHLPGAVSSHAFAAGYGGQVVGDSGAGQHCYHADNSSERAALWMGTRPYDLNTLIPASEGITLTYAYSINRSGQITAGGYANDEPMSQCITNSIDPETGLLVIALAPCHNMRMYVLTPAGS